MESGKIRNLHDQDGPGYGARASRRSFTFLVLIIAAVVFFAAGFYWHDRIMAAFGERQMTSTEPNASTPSARSKQLWTCGMHPQVIQDHPGDCPICHMKLTPLQRDDDSGEGAVGNARKIVYWWDPMLGASSITDKPGKSAMGMELVPVYAEDVSGGMGVKIDPVVVQNMGVRVATVIRGPLQQTIRSVGYLEEAEPLVHDVNLRVSGWIEKLYAATEGQHVQKGAPLFDLYSPEVQVAVQELIAARKAHASASGKDDLASQTNDTLVRSGREKLNQWGLDAAEIEKLASLDKAPRTVTFKSPISGHVTIKNVVDGSSVKAGDRVLQIVDHGTLWLDVQVFEQDLPYIKLGQSVTASLQATRGKPVEGRLIFISPHVDPSTRTATVRVELSNPDMTLRPGMYATAEIRSVLSDDAILVPREAVIDTGSRTIAFVSDGNGRFEPRSMKLGVSGENDVVEVLSGVSPGESVVTSGQFLLDAESRMREAIKRHLDQQLLMPAESKGSVVSDATRSDAQPSTMPGAAGNADAPSSERAVTMSVLIGHADEVYRAYLALEEQFASVESPVVDAKPLLTAARLLAESDAGKNEKSTQRVVDAAALLDGQKVDEQRKGFKDLSDAVLVLASVFPPSDALGAKLFVAHCPMAFDTGADWLQTKAEIINPYLTDMRTCGSITRTISTVSAKAKE